MPRIIVGYGDYNDYRLTELPPDVLGQLRARYPKTSQQEHPPPGSSHSLRIVTCPPPF